MEHHFNAVQRAVLLKSYQKKHISGMIINKENSEIIEDKKSKCTSCEPN